MNKRVKRRRITCSRSYRQWSQGIFRNRGIETLVKTKDEYEQIILDTLCFHFKENFKYPYISQSIKKFWRRWNISFGSWFMEYVYIPVGGNREGKWRLIEKLFLQKNMTRGLKLFVIYSTYNPFIYFRF